MRMRHPKSPRRRGTVPLIQRVAPILPAIVLLISIAEVSFAAAPDLLPIPLTDDGVTNIVELRENDGVPVVSDGTNYTWRIFAYNNSDTMPTSFPWNVVMTQVKLENIHSIGVPDVWVDPGWSASVTAQGGNLYKIIFTSTAPPTRIRPGYERDFTITTHGIAGKDIRSGSCSGYGDLDGEGWHPRDADSFICQTGVDYLAPDPALAISAISISSNTISVSVTNLTQHLEYRIEKVSQLNSDWGTGTVFEATGAETNWTDEECGMGCFYRVIGIGE